MVLHLSYSSGSSDGGIATAVECLVEAQGVHGLSPAWITAERFPPLRRDNDIFSAVAAAAPQLLHLHGLWRSPTRIATRLTSSSFPFVTSLTGCSIHAPLLFLVGKSLLFGAFGSVEPCRVPTAYMPFVLLRLLQFAHYSQYTNRFDT